MKRLALNLVLFLSFFAAFQWAANLIWIYGFFRPKETPDGQLALAIGLTVGLFIAFAVSMSVTVFRFFWPKDLKGANNDPPG